MNCWGKFEFDFWVEHFFVILYLPYDWTPDYQNLIPEKSEGQQKISILTICLIVNSNSKSHQ